MTTNAPDGWGIGLGLPDLLSSKLVFNDALPLTSLKSSPDPFSSLGMGHPQLRWPYTARHRSSIHTFGGYESSPTPSSPSASESASEDADPGRRGGASTTHDVLLSYFSPTFSDTSEFDQGASEKKKVYLLSTGLKNPQPLHHRRTKSETFRFPLPPSTKLAPLKSALKRPPTTTASPPLRSSSGALRRVSWKAPSLSPQLEEDLLVAAKQGWSPYSSVAPTPRQVSGSTPSRFSVASNYTIEALTLSPPSSCSSRTLVSSSSSESETEGESEDAVKLTRLHASLALLEAAGGGVGERGEVALEQENGSSVEEKMAYLYGLGYRYKKKSGARRGRTTSRDFARRSDEEGEMDVKEGMVESFAPRMGKAVRVVSNTASAVTSSVCSPILCGSLAAKREDDEADVTVKPSSAGSFLPGEDELLGEEFSFVLDDSLFSNLDTDIEPAKRVRETGLFTPPLSTPELGLEGSGSPMLLDGLPSPLGFKSGFGKALGLSPRVEGCRPYSTASSVNPFAYALSPEQPTPGGFKSRPDSLNKAAKEFQDEHMVEDEAEGDVTIETASRTTLTPTRATVSILSRPRPLRSSGSNNSLFSSASSDQLQKPLSPISVLARPRPVQANSSHSCGFLSKSTASLPLYKKKPVAKMTKLSSTTTVVSARAPAEEGGVWIHVPQRKSSLDVRAHAHAQAVAVAVHPNSVSRDPELINKFHSSASPYLSARSRMSLTEKEGGMVCASAAKVAKARRGKGWEGEEEGGMTKSISLPVLYTARTPSQRKRGESGMKGTGQRRKSVVTVGPKEEDGEFRVHPPQGGVWVVEEQVTRFGYAL